MNIKYFQQLINIANDIQLHIDDAKRDNHHERAQTYMNHQQVFLYVANLRTYHPSTDKAKMWYMPRYNQTYYDHLDKPTVEQMQQACDFYVHSDLFAYVHDDDTTKKERACCKHYRFHWTQTAQIDTLPNVLHPAKPRV